MDKRIIAKELVKIAKDIQAMNFPTQEALNQYLRQHPNADRSQHKVAPPTPKKRKYDLPDYKKNYEPPWKHNKNY